MFVAMDLLEELKPELLKADLAAVDRVEVRLASEPRSSIAALARADKTGLSVFGRLALLLALERAAPEDEELAVRAGQVKALLAGVWESKRSRDEEPENPASSSSSSSSLQPPLKAARSDYPEVASAAAAAAQMAAYQFFMQQQYGGAVLPLPSPSPSPSPSPALSSSFLPNVHAPLDPPAHGWFCPYCSTTNPVHDLTCAKCGSNGLAQGALPAPEGRPVLRTNKRLPKLDEPCRFFQRGQACARGEDCRFRH